MPRGLFDCRRGTLAKNAFTLHRSWSRPAHIGFLGATTPKAWAAFVDAFEQGLRSKQWTIGESVSIDYRWAQGSAKSYRDIARGFASDGVDIIMTSGTAPVQAAIAAAPKIPLVFASAGGFDQTSFGKANVAGFSNRQPKLAAKRLAVLRKMVPRMKTLAVLGSFGLDNADDEFKALGTPSGLKIVKCKVGPATGIAGQIKALRGKADALYVITDPYITTNAVAINIAAAAAGLPTMHAFRDYVEAGGLASFGPDFRTMFRNAAELVDKILQGTPAQQLSVHDDTTTELVVNRSTAKVLGITIPAGAKKIG